ncbi:MAG: hypothetical protein HKN07_14380 [Acidimicrobiia bacterium]|nr:hypothetical protein [Acidimicrobiia bacterium]
MTEEPRQRRIEIPSDVADEAGVPEDLQSDVDDLEYFVPNTLRRRKIGKVYLVLAVLIGLVIVLTDLPVLMGLVPGLLLVLGVHHHLAGWDLVVREQRALDSANRHVEFPVGHASATVNFEGWRARPVWNVLVFSAEDPPTKRGLVRLDGITGNIMEAYVEDIPAADAVEAG